MIKTSDVLMFRATYNFVRTLELEKQEKLKLDGYKLIIEWIDFEKSKIKTNIGWFSNDFISNAIEKNLILEIE